MGTDYLAPLALPGGASPERLGRVLGLPVEAVPAGWLEGAGTAGGPLAPGSAWPVDDLLVRAVGAGDGMEPAGARALLGVDADVTLVVSDLAPTTPASLRRAAARTVNAVARLAAVPGARAVLFEELTDDGVLLRLGDGRVVLNETWPGWRAIPCLADSLDAAHTTAPLRLRP